MIWWWPKPCFNTRFSKTRRPGLFWAGLLPSKSMFWPKPSSICWNLPAAKPSGRTKAQHGDNHLAVLAKYLPGTVIGQRIMITIAPLLARFFPSIHQLKMRFDTQHNTVDIKTGAGVFTLPMLKHIGTQINKLTVCHQCGAVVTLQPLFHRQHLRSIKLAALFHQAGQTAEGF